MALEAEPREERATNRPQYVVVDDHGREHPVGWGDSGHRNALALIEALERAGEETLALVPPRPDGQPSPAARWMQEHSAVPVQIVSAGREAQAAYLLAALHINRDQAAAMLDINEGTVIQYCSNLRHTNHRRR